MSAKTQNTWIWGDGHSHSYWSDGLESIGALTNFYKKLDIDFRFQTDHCGIKMPDGIYLRKKNVAEKGHLLIPDNFKNYLDECRLSSDNEHIVLPGIELDLDYGSFELNAQNNYSHINVYNFTEHSQIPPDSWYKSKSLLDVFKGLRERGLIVGFAHIDDGFIPWQELSDQFDFFEITYNTCFEQFPPLAQGVLKLGFWDKWLSSGLNIPISTGSDSHQAEHAGFSMRNVLMTEERTEAAILKSFSQGKSYIAGTWHPDIYSEEGFSETYWFRMVEKNNRLQAFPLLRRLREKMFENNYGRIKKKSYPTLNMTLEGRNLGDSIKINSGTAPALKLRIKMNVPIHTIDLIANGLIIKRITPGTSDFAERISLSGLKGKSYLRAQIQGGKKKECREWLISNPIYIV